MTTVASGVHAAALDRLAAADAELGPGVWRTLAPGGDWVRSLHAIGVGVLVDDDSPALGDALAEGLAAIAVAMRDSFPDNVFGDLDALAASLVGQARAQPAGGAVDYLRVQTERVAALQHLFGRGTAIRFRYVHDFVYGFDWAKWVARDPGARAQVGPFGPAFLEFMWNRGQQLLTLIADGDDRKYPPLPDGRPRNPFGFSREPVAEIALHRHLAREGLLPVEAWRTAAAPRWDRQFQGLRRQAAAELGLADADVLTPEPAMG
ncbi:MAG: ferrochelatase [Deltaproteobacteria bacterium]|nr:ferrochelatase [Deltaproteobacteria bacterium]